MPSEPDESQARIQRLLNWLEVTNLVFDYVVFPALLLVNFLTWEFGLTGFKTMVGTQLLVIGTMVYGGEILE